MADFTSKAKTEQVNNTSPGSTNRNLSKKYSTDLLPEYFQSDTNKKFLNATLDPMIESGVSENKSGYIGKKTGKIRSSVDDSYLPSRSTLDNRYQLEPGVVSQRTDTGEYESAYTYSDVINKLKFLDSNTTNLDKLFADNNYSWRPPIDFDMFINWNNYVWLPFGLPIFGLHGTTASAVEGLAQFTSDAQTEYGSRTIKLENGMRITFSNDNNVYLVTGVGSKIRLIVESTYSASDTAWQSNLTSITPYAHGVANQTIATGAVTTSSNAVNAISISAGATQGTGYVYKPFFNIYDSSGTPSTHAIASGSIGTDGKVSTTITATGGGGYGASAGVHLLVVGGQKVTPFKNGQNTDVHWRHEYLTIDRGARDNNTWSRTNNWYHIDTVKAVNTFIGVASTFKIGDSVASPSSSTTLGQTLDDSDYAQRPIICWEKDLRLYSHGIESRKPVAMVISTLSDPGSDLASNLVHNGYTVQVGDRVLITNASTGINNQICTVGNSYALTAITNDNSRSTAVPNHGDVVTIMNGPTLYDWNKSYSTGNIVKFKNVYFSSLVNNNKGVTPGEDATKWQTSSATLVKGIDYYYNAKLDTWSATQEKEIPNKHPLYELYDAKHQPLSHYKETDFTGSTVFEYLEDTTSATRKNDDYLKFPLSYSSSSYITTTNTSNLIFNNSVIQTTYQYNTFTTGVDIKGLYYLQKYDVIDGKHYYDNCWHQSYKQVRTPITVTQEVTSAIADLSVDLGTTNYEPERDFWLKANTTGWEFHLDSAYGYEKLTGINPTLYLARGKTYTFDVTNGTTSLAFQNKAGSSFTSGISTSGTKTTFEVDAAETNSILYYTAPGSSTGKIIIIDQVLEQGWPEVFHNGNKLLRNVHYTFNGQNIVIPYKTGNSSYAQAISNNEDILAVGDIVDVKFFTTDTSATDEWTYDVSNSIKNNSNNSEVQYIQYSELFNHFIDVIEKQPGRTGSSFGSNNYRNLDKTKRFGGIINQQLSSLLKTGFTLSNEDYDVLLALEYVSDSYNVFKKKFVQKIEQLNKSMASSPTISGLIDQALYDINLGKNNTFPFANSDMMYYFNLVEKTYSVSSSTSNFNLPRNITRTNQYKNHVYVYTIDTNGVETYLTSDLYTLDTTSTTNKITLNSAVSSGKVVIKVSIDQGLSFIPPTLTKLGITSCIKPTYYLDNTGSRQVVIIEGHDGSKTVSFNTTVDSDLTPSLTDVRDKALFELENRIYDHIQSSFKNKRKDLTYIPGKYRTTPYTKTEQNNFYDNYFNSYRVSKGITTLTNSSYDANNKFTHNYSSTQSEGIGYWRGIYRHYFDTDRPHTHPWEMLGFVEKPSWWDARYGSPTTKTTNDNCWANATKKAALESALQKGIISEPTTTIVQDINVARPGATFPVTGAGTAGGTDATVTLQDPDTWSLTSPTANEAKAAFKFGDGSPIETVWLRSSIFPYVENKFLHSSNPGKYLEDNYDVLDKINDGPDASTTLKVTVANDGTQNRFYIDGIPQKTLKLEQGKTYIFDQTDSSNAGSLTYTSNHPLYLTTIRDTEGSIYSQGTQQVWKIGSTDYNTFAGSSNYEQSFKSNNTGDRYTQLIIPKGTAISQLYYSCGNHSGMGGIIEIVDSKHELQKISEKTKKRHNTNELYIHNEVDTTNLTRRVLGIQQLMVDRLMFLGNEIYKDFARQIRQLNSKQMYKIQGYSNKNNISLLADSLQSELSDNFIPADNISLKLHKSSPYKKIVYSGVEIIKSSTGYTINGWHNDEPYFNVLPSVKVSGRAVTIGKTNLIRYVNYGTSPVKVNYGTTFNNIQDVYWFLLEYEKYLESVGFVFNNVDANNNIQNWNFAANQFVIWAESNWDVNTSVQLSPVGKSMTLTLAHGYLKNNEDEYGSAYLDKDKNLLNLSEISVDRQYKEVTVKCKNDDKAIYCAILVVCDYEHLLILDNTTIFNDIVYSPLLGEEKLRLKIDYQKTSNWNGTFYAPGYIVNNDTIFENFDKSVSNVNYELFDETQHLTDSNLSGVARKNIGYEKKQFLRNMRLSDDVQFQFMKGLLHKKGTPESFNRLIRSTFLLESSVDIDLEEEWMFRLGEFGPLPTQQTQEFTLKQSDIKTNPQLIRFDAIFSGQARDIDYDATISMLKGDSRWLEEPANDPPISFTQGSLDRDLSNFEEIETDEKNLPNAGYLKLDEVTYTMFNKKDLPKLYDTYKDVKDQGALSSIYNLTQTDGWRDNRSYAIGSFVRHKGQRWTNSVITSAKQSFRGINNALRTTYYSSTVFTAYNNGTTYGINAYVSHTDSGTTTNYRSIASSFSNVTPGTDATKWVAVGVAGSSHNDFPTWNANFAYDGTDNSSTNPDYVVYEGAEYKATTTANNLNKNPSTETGFWTKTGDLYVAGLHIDKCVFSYDNTTKLTAATDPFATSNLGVEVRIGDFNTTYYPMQSRDSTNTKVDGLGEYTYAFTFGPTSVPYSKLPADNDFIYISAFQYRASSSDSNPWTAVSENGLFTAWFADDENTQSWDVVGLHDKNLDVELVCPGYDTGNEALVKLNQSHSLSIGDYVFIVGAENNAGLNGIHKVTGFPSGSDCATCGSRSDKQFYIDQYIAVNEQYCKCFVIRSHRFLGTDDLYNAVTDSKYAWNDGWVAYADSYYRVQSLTLKYQSDTTTTGGQYLSSGIEQTAYTLSYSVSSASDITVYIGTGRTLLPASTGGSVAWTVSGTTITFTPANISQWVIGQPLEIIFKNTTGLGYGVYSYDLSSTNWSVKRQQQTKTDSNQISNVLIYDYIDNKELGKAEVWDPFKGIIPGVAEVEIDSSTRYDQALYSNSTEETKEVVDERYWDKEKVGETWWDLSTVRYLDYEQKLDLDYSFKNWGAKFPGSSIDIYEWTKSTVTPDEWSTLANGEFVIDGEVASGEAYYKIIDDQIYYYWSQDTEYNPYTGTEVTYYYFWVKNKRTVPKSNPYRNFSVLEVAQYIDNPTESGIFWASPAGTSSLISGNLEKILNKNSTVQINFTNSVGQTHKEWLTLRENDSSVVPRILANRMHESILGFDQTKTTLGLVGQETAVGGSINTVSYNWSGDLEYPANSVVSYSGNLHNNAISIELESARLMLSLPTIANYAGGTTYAKDAIVNDATNKIQYISLANSNTGNALTSASHWAKHYPEIRISPIANSLTFGAVVTIDPPVGNTLGLPLPDVTAFAFPNIVGGVIDSITIVREGSGYQSKPNVYISYPETSTGTRATVIDADVTLTNGSITAITMNAARKGSGYVQSYAKIENEVVELKYYDRYATEKFLSDTNYLQNFDFNANATTYWSTQAGALAITSTSGEVLNGTYSGKFTISSGTQVGYVGQKIDITLPAYAGITAGVKHLIKIKFRSSSAWSGSGSASLSYGHASSSQTNFSGFTVETSDTIAITSVAANELYGLQLEVVAQSDRYQSVFLKIDLQSSPSSDVIIFVDDIEFTNVSTGDRLLVTRGTNHPVTTTASTIVAHDQFASFNEIGNFSRQPWTQLLTGTYEYLDDNTISYEAPNRVPDLRLNELFRYGSQIRPYKQSLIKDRLKAIRVVVQKVNELLLTINLSDSQLNWRKRLGGTFNKGNTTYTPQDYWVYADWFHPDYTINSSTVTQQTVNTRNELYDVNTSLYTTVRVDDDDGAGAWAFYQWVSNQWLKTGKQNGTIQIKETLYNINDEDGGWDAVEWDITGWDKNYNNEFLNILDALRLDVFVGAYQSFYKEFFFAMIRYIYSEQENIDWIAKSSVLQLTRSTPLNLTPKTFDIGSEDDILEFLNDTKPYHSKIETIADARTIIEESKTTATEVLDIRVQTNTSGSTEAAASRAFRIFITDAGTRKYEAIINTKKTTLTSAITATATSIPVTSASAVKETGNTGTIVIGSERITFTGVSTNTLTGCTRGVDGTTPQAHANSASVVKAGTDMNLTLATDPLGYPAFNPSANTTIAGTSPIQGLAVTKGTI